MLTIRELPVEDRPRERIIRLGAKSLSDAELLALLIGSGGRGNDVLSLAARVVEEADRKNLELTIDELTAIPGLGQAKAAIIIAAIEFSRRRIAPDGVKVRSAGDIIPLVQHMADRKQETFICISLSGAHEVIACRVVTLGLLNACQVHPREVFADPLKDRACSVIVAHNHPSGELTPSPEDYKVTERLRAAAGVLGINFLDHVVFSRRGYYSITEGVKREAGMIPKDRDL